MSLGFIAAILAIASPTAAASSDAMAIERLVDRFNTARAGFDDAALGTTLAPDYEEISPIGDVDDRAAVLGFYRPTARKPVPPMQSSERHVAVHGAMGIETERRSVTLSRPDGTSVTRAIRVRYVAMRGRDGWKLLSVQYTPMPSAK